MTADEVRAGALSELQAAAASPHQGRNAAGGRVLGRRRRLRDRRPVPASRVSVASGHRRGRARHLPLAPRPLRPRIGLHARSLGRRRAWLRSRRARRRRVRAPAGPRRSGRASPGPPAQRAGRRHLARRRQVGARTPRCGRAGVGDRADGRGVRRSLPPFGLGLPASRCWWRWRTSSPNSTRPTTRSRSCTGSRLLRATRAITHHASRLVRSRRKRFRWIGSALGTGASSTPDLRTRRSARSKPRSQNRAGWARSSR